MEIYTPASGLTNHIVLGIVKLATSILVGLLIAWIMRRGILTGAKAREVSALSGEIVTQVTRGKQAAIAWMILGIGTFIGAVILFKAASEPLGSTSAQNGQWLGQLIIVLSICFGSFSYLRGMAVEREKWKLVIGTTSLSFYRGVSRPVQIVPYRNIEKIFIFSRSHVPWVAIRLVNPKDPETQWDVGDLTRRMNRHSGGYDFALDATFDLPPEQIVAAVRSRMGLPAH